MAIVQGIVGPPTAAQSIGPAVGANIRLGQQADLIASELHGRFYEANYRYGLFSGFVDTVALSANTITLVATATPIIGVWNPATSTVNLEILQISVQAIVNTLTAPVEPGMFRLAASAGNGAITTGNAPINRRTLAASGSQAKFFTPSVALTGLTNNLVVISAGEFQSGTGQTHGTVGNTAPFAPSVGGTMNVDGSLIVPPGAVLALLNTTSTTTYSVAASILWNEVPV